MRRFEATGVAERFGSVGAGVGRALRWVGGGAVNWLETLSPITRFGSTDGVGERRAAR